MGAVDLPPLIRGRGTDELSWRRWLARLRCHELYLQDWLPAHARLVVVAPHPDDEILACGGLIATHVAQGGRVQIVAVTDGEASHDETPSIPRHELAEVRRQERWQGLHHLGLPEPSVLSLGLADGQVHAQRVDLMDSLTSLLQLGDVVVSTWDKDGHPDHDAAGQAARDACTAKGCTHLCAPVWMWHWATPADERIPWRRLRGLPLSATASARKRAALGAHHSQLSPRSTDLGPVLGHEIVKRAAWRTEYFFT